MDLTELKQMIEAAEEQMMGGNTVEAEELLQDALIWIDNNTEE